MFITGLGLALPPRRFTQTECWEAFQAAPQFARLTPRSRKLLQKVLLDDNGIATRYTVIDSLSEAFELTSDILHARFARHAPALATQAAEHALRSAGKTPRDIDAVIISTCTGYLCPGLTSYVSERLGLRPDVLALDLVGQGCGAAMPNLRTADALLSAGRAQNVLCVCVEVCSAAFYLDDDPGVLISACLFGDAAGAAVVSSVPNPEVRRVCWQASHSELNAGARDRLCFEQREGMLRNVLTRTVPALAAEEAEKVLTRALAENGVAREEIRAWLWHAGGRDVLQALQARLGLAAEDMRWSAATLRELGNVSSPFILHVLHRALAQGAPGGHWWLASFGAGFSSHGALLHVE